MKKWSAGQSCHNAHPPPHPHAHKNTPQRNNNALFPPRAVLPTARGKAPGGACNNSFHPSGRNSQSVSAAARRRRFNRDHASTKEETKASARSARAAKAAPASERGS
eukprot:1410342-Alexandrium_andersonii.AAC.1